jgi:hypothetical protein
VADKELKTTPMIFLGRNPQIYKTALYSIKNKDKVLISGK